MKRKLIILSLIIFIFSFGCKSNNLTYIGSDAQTIVVDHVKTALNPSIPVYKKKIEEGFISIGCFQSPQGNLVGCIVKYQNQYDKKVSINLDDFVAKANDNYTLKKINPDLYIYAILGEAQDAKIEGERKQIKNQRNHSNIRSGETAFATGSIKAYARSSAYEQASKYKDYAFEVDAHALRGISYIEPQSWDYYYLFFENPPEYPILVYYKEIQFKFTY